MSSALLGRTPGSPREARVLLSSWAAQGPAERGPKSPMSPLPGPPKGLCQSPHQSSEMGSWNRDSASGCDCRVLASRDHGSPTEGWALQASSVLLQTEEKLLPPHQPLPQTRQPPALGSDPFWKVHCVPGLSLHLRGHHLISSSQSFFISRLQIWGGERCRSLPSVTEL